jgi:hypothetical protein
MKYVARCQYMLQQGTFVADVLYYTGEGAPNNLAYRPNLRPRIPAGYDYDGCDTLTLMRLSVRDGRLVLPSGMSYRVLVLPESPLMTPAVARKVRDLVRDGATVVGPKPVSSPSLVGYPECDEEVARIGEEVWGSKEANKNAANHLFGKGQVFVGVSLEKYFEFATVPDFQYVSLSGGSKLAYIHRKIGDADVYFVSNQQYRQSDAICKFRVTGRIPELWHADTGKIEEAPVWSAEDTPMSVQLRLGPAESVFVVFRKESKGDDVTQIVTSEQIVTGNAPKIEIKLARYEAADGRGADVTEIVREMVREGTYEIPASNGVFGDPVVNVVKQLRIDYVRDGVPMTQTVPENGTLMLIELPQVRAEIPSYYLAKRGAKTFMASFKAFEYDVSRGRSYRNTKADASEDVEVNGPWRVEFAKGWGAPARVELPSLMSWTEHSDPGVKYFSGSAVYTKSFNVPASMLRGDRLVVLDLGRVKNFATVTLNGKDLGVLWKEPFTVDVTSAIRAGRNELRVKVTNLWVNRIIGDEQLPADVEWNGQQLTGWPEWLVKNEPRPKTGRYTFTTWKFWSKDSALLESGLIGPVVVRSAKWVELKQ